MAYSGTGTEADPYVVDNLADFKTCINNGSGKFVKLAADIDFGTSSSNVKIPLAANTTIDGDGHKLKNMGYVATSSSSGPFFNGGSNCMFKNIELEMLFIESGTNSYSFNVFFYNNAFDYYKISFYNCNIKARIYLCNTTNNSHSYGDTRTFINSNSIEKCNITIDIYYIMAHSDIKILDGDNQNTANLKDSVIKINMYDPNGWATNIGFGSYGASYSGNFGENYDSSDTSKQQDAYQYTPRFLLYKFNVSNCAIFFNFKADINMNNKYFCACISYCNFTNSYFVFENSGNASVRPLLSASYFVTYAFYDNEKANWKFYNLTYHYGSSQLKGLTTAQCTSRSTFEGPDAIFPFKLKQQVEP